jgi:hypothetical protein
VVMKRGDEKYFRDLCLGQEMMEALFVIMWY